MPTLALEDLTEANEEAGANYADDFALERRVPSRLEERRLKQPGEANLVRLVLDLRHLALPGREVLGQIG